MLYNGSCRELYYPEEEEEEVDNDDDGGEILGGTGYGRWGRVFLFFLKVHRVMTDATQNCSA